MDPQQAEFLQQQAVAQAFVQAQMAQQAAQQQAAQPPPVPPQPQVPPNTVLLHAADLQNMILALTNNQHAPQPVPQPVPVPVPQSDLPGVLPKHIRSLHKPPTYENRDKSGKFLHFECALRQYLKVQDMDPANPADAAHCRLVAEICCIGEAQSYIQRLAACNTDPTHPIWTFEGLIAALRQHFTQPEESAVARRTLDNLKLTKHMSVRDYIQHFNTLLDDLPSMSNSDVLYTFAKGLPDELQMWLRHDDPQNLQDAENIVVKMSGSAAKDASMPSGSAPPSTPEPMQINSLLSTLSALQLGPNKKPPDKPRYPPDPRRDRRWPSWARNMSSHEIDRLRRERRCFLCYKQGHPWTDCFRLNNRPRSPSPQGLAARSPSPPSWRACPPSPGKGAGHPNV